MLVPLTDIFSLYIVCFMVKTYYSSQFTLAEKIRLEVTVSAIVGLNSNLNNLTIQKLSLIVRLLFSLE